MTEELNFPARTFSVEGDEMLRLLAQFTGSQISMSIMLVVSGAVLTGMLISRDEWYQEWLTEVKGASDAGKDFSAALKTVTTEMGMHVIDDDLPSKDRPSKLHLKNGYVHAGGDRTGPYLLRVRVDTVSAWSLGTPNQVGS